MSHDWTEKQTLRRWVCYLLEAAKLGYAEIALFHVKLFGPLSRTDGQTTMIECISREAMI
ncbi:MAG: hypothetical protein KTR25_10940 [Myxococcales bacterium]|nr:hypothetical protein [Myxococcales bacterium]